MRLFIQFNLDFSFFHFYCFYSCFRKRSHILLKDQSMELFMRCSSRIPCPLSNRKIEARNVDASNWTSSTRGPAISMSARALHTFCVHVASKLNRYQLSKPTLATACRNWTGRGGARGTSSKTISFERAATGLMYPCTPMGSTLGLPKANRACSP